MVTRYAPLTVNRTLSRNLEVLRGEVVDAEDARAQLGALLQAALHLEFSTIPVYLSAAFSFVNGNEAIQRLITRIAIEEMLHFIIVANTMNAIGIVPDIEAAVPTYPFDLDLLEPPLHLELKSYTPELVEQLFLRIETPRNPILFKARLAAVPKTVGEFYEGIIDIIAGGKIPGLFEVDPTLRNVPVIPNPPAFREIAYRDDNDARKFAIPASIDFAITDIASAVRHLKWLVDQGEGTSKTDTDPIDLSGLPAHYYRFVSILKGKYLVADSGAELGYSYSGGSLPFDPGAVRDCDPNPRIADYAEYPGLVDKMTKFTDAYSSMIDALKAAFNSRDAAAAKTNLQTSVGYMQGMLGMAQAIHRAADRAGVKAGVAFERHPSRSTRS